MKVFFYSWEQFSLSKTSLLLDSSRRIGYEMSCEVVEEITVGDDVLSMAYLVGAE